MTTLKGRYRIVETLGTSAEAVVYAADDLANDRRVAVAVLRGEAATDAEFVTAVREQTYRLAKPASAHRALVAVYECDVTDEGDLFVALELVAGRSLREILDERGALDLPTTLRLSVQIGEALETLHRNGVVHGELRPESVAVVKDEDGSEAVKLVGLELASGRRTAVGLRLRDASLLPSLAPEQIQGGETSEATDVHGLGLLIQELLTGERPRATGPRLRPAGDLPPVIGRTVAKALESRPERRYANVSLMVNDLWSAQSEPSKSDPASVIHILNERRATARRRARSDVGMAIALVVGLVLVGLTAWVVRSDRLTGNARAASVDSPVAASPVGLPTPSLVNTLTVEPPRLPAPPAATPDARPAMPDSKSVPPDAKPIAGPQASGEAAAAVPAGPVARTSSPTEPSPARLDERGPEGADGSAIIDWLLKGRRPSR